MLEVWCSGKRFDCSVRKALDKDSTKPRPELFPCDPSGSARRIRSHKLKSAWFHISEPLHFQKNPILAALFHPQNTARQIPLIRPQVHHHGLARGPHLVMQSSELGEPFAVLANFHASRRCHFSQRAVELSPVIRERVQ